MGIRFSAPLIMLLTLPVGLGGQEQIADTSLSGWHPVQIETLVGMHGLDSTSVLHFRNGHTFDTGIFKVEFLGVLQAHSKDPFLILAGRECYPCDVNTAIYLHSPSDGPIGTGIRSAYVYPGELYDSYSGKRVSHSRAFMGQCLPNRQPGIVWYQEKFEEEDKKSFVYLLEVVADSIRVEHFKDPPLPQIQVTLQLVEDGMCTEIPGVRQAIPE